MLAQTMRPSDDEDGERRGGSDFVERDGIDAHAALMVRDDDVHDVGAAGDVFGRRRSRRGRCGQTVTHGWGF